MQGVKKIAVIGAGVCGMMTIATLKEEGLEPICFEKSSDPGGTWCYREEPIQGLPSLMPTTVVNHSKELSSFSTYPPGKDYNNYMRHKEMHKYCLEYATEKDILKHIQYNMEVISVKQSEDYDETGRWTMSIKNVLTGQESTDIYDGVIVCVGQLAYPSLPTFPEQEKFKGNISHSHDLKCPDMYKGQTVVVVGTGCSGLDAAVEVSRFADQVYLSTRQGVWIISRVGPHGKPIDRVLLRRYLATMLSIFPIKLCSWVVEKFFLDPLYDHKMYNVKPQSPLLHKDPAVSDAIASKLLSGAVRQVKTIHHFTEDGVVFDGNDHVTKVDAVIMATGYTWKFPFLEDDIIRHEDGKVHLYRCIYPPHLKHSTLAVIGFILPYGPGIPIGELQSRFVAHVMAGKHQLPSRKKMEREIEKRYQKNKKRFESNDKLSLRVDYMQYLDTIASELGVRPNFVKIFFTDIRLFWRLYFGPVLPYQYRLKGVHKWDDARNAIMTSRDRYRAPLHAGSSE